MHAVIYFHCLTPKNTVYTCRCCYCKAISNNNAAYLFLVVKPLDPISNLIFQHLLLLDLYLTVQSTVFICQVQRYQSSAIRDFLRLLPVKRTTALRQTLSFSHTSITKSLMQCKPKNSKRKTACGTFTDIVSDLNLENEPMFAHAGF